MVGNNPVDKWDALGFFDRSMDIVIGSFSYDISQKDKEQISKITNSLQSIVDKCRKLLKDDCPCKVNVKIIDDASKNMSPEKREEYNKLFDFYKTKRHGTFIANDILKEHSSTEAIHILVIPWFWANYLGLSDENGSILISSDALKDNPDYAYVLHHELGHNGQYRPPYEDKYKDKYDHSNTPGSIMYPFANKGDKIDEPYCKALLKNCK